MRQTLFKKLLVAVVLPLSLILLTGCSYLDQAKDKLSDNNPTQTPVEQPVAQSLELEIVNQDDTQDLRTLEFEEDETLYEILSREISNSEDLSIGFDAFEFDGKEAFFIKSINGYDPSTDNAFWSLKVNGEPSSVGISDYKPAAGDKVLLEPEALN